MKHETEGRWLNRGKPKPESLPQFVQISRCGAGNRELQNWNPDFRGGRGEETYGGSVEEGPRSLLTNFQPKPPPESAGISKTGR
ncbi:hypothetical protein NL676_026087 [Syzygium grande]|nr:hypothetical protein NL676_026087 [Syzygium grande]